MEFFVSGVREDGVVMKYGVVMKDEVVMKNEVMIINGVKMSDWVNIGPAPLHTTISSVSRSGAVYRYCSDQYCNTTQRPPLWLSGSIVVAKTATICPYSGLLRSFFAISTNLFVSLIEEQLQRYVSWSIVIVEWPLRYHSATTMSSGEDPILI